MVLGGIIWVATEVKDGLMPKITGKSSFIRYIELNAGETIKFDFSYGIISLYSIQKGSSYLIILGYKSVEIFYEGILNLISTNVNDNDRIIIFKESEYLLSIKNNRSEQFRFYIENL